MVIIEHDDIGLEQITFAPREDGLALCLSYTNVLDEKVLVRLLVPADKLREYHELCLLRAAVVAGELMPPLPDPIPVEIDLDTPLALDSEENGPPE